MACHGCQALGLGRRAAANTYSRKPVEPNTVMQKESNRVIRSLLRLFPSMPKQFLSSPVVYIIVGLYRTIHDSTIRVPVWVRADASYSIKSKIDSHDGFRPSFDMD